MSCPTAFGQDASIPYDVMDPNSIPIAGPWISDKEIEYAATAAATAWYEAAGSYVRQFETAFAAYVGVKHAVAVPHCTAAIHLALKALGVGKGDEVIVPELTWIASSAPIDYVGAAPVFADVDPKTWCVTSTALGACLTPHTKAIVAVDLYGCMPEMEAITRFAHEHGLALIEDAAEAAGSEYQGRRAGSFGDAGVFSFHGSKTLTTGEGGMLVTDRDDVYERALFLRDHGRHPGDVRFRNEEVAFKYRMSDLQAAVGLAQLERIDELVGKKREIFTWYREELRDLGALEWNAEPANVRNAYWMTTVMWPEPLRIDKLQAMRWFADRGIATRPFFDPLSSLPAYRGQTCAAAGQGRNRNAYGISRRGLNLPSHLRLQEAEVRRVASALRELLDIKGDRREVA